jgi:ABC-type bacteriocin/lantibiotic exporter with double-glycine peptidase domain
MVLDESIDALDEEDRRRVLRNVCNPSAPWTLILITRWDEIAEYAGRTVTLNPGDIGMLPEPPRQRLEV